MNADMSELSQMAFDALAHAVAGDTDKTAEILTAIGEGSDFHQMYGVCCGFAEAGHHMLKQLYGDHAPKPGTDDMWAIQPLIPGALDDPVKAFSVRFLIAHCNGDRDTTLALYDTAAQAAPEDFVASVCQLLTDIAGISRLAIEKRDRS